MRVLALLLVIVAGFTVISMMVWTAIGWARSDRDRIQRQEREREQNGSGE
jgi:sensor domain CHASE-containing protein